VYTTAKKTGIRALALVVMVAAMALAGTVGFAAQARAGSFADSPPKAVLMKYKTVIQAREVVAAHWYRQPRPLRRHLPQGRRGGGGQEAAREAAQAGAPQLLKDTRL